MSWGCQIICSKSNRREMSGASRWIAPRRGWQSLALTVDKQTLLQSQTDSAARSHLMGVFRQRLSARKPRARKRS